MYRNAQPPRGRLTDAQSSGNDNDEWAKTRALTAMPTQLADDKEDYLAGAVKDVGRRIGPNHHELFVVCDPADALNQQLEHLAPEYIALHDVGADTSQPMLRAVATALNGTVQQLAIRRQGFGVTLATLAFVELPGAHGKAALRLYCTRADATDPGQSALLAQAMLGHSRLAVLVVGATQPAQQTERELGALSDVMASSAWSNRQVLCLPVNSTAARSLAGFARTAPHGINVLVGQPVQGHDDAWPVVQDVWTQMRAGKAPMLAPAASSGSSATVASQAARTVGPSPSAKPGPAVPAPLALRAMPVVGQDSAKLSSPPSVWTAYLEECADIAGVVSCCVFELETQRTLAFLGGRPGPASLAAQGAALHKSAVDAARALGLAPGQPDLAITFNDHFLLLRSLPGHPGLALHAVLDARVGNLTLARMKLQRIDTPPAR